MNKIHEQCINLSYIYNTYKHTYTYIQIEIYTYYIICIYIYVYKQTYIWYTYDIHNIQYIHNIHHRHHIQKHPGGPETVLVKTTFFKKNTIFAMAKHTFLQAELCQILAREFGKIRVSCGFWIHFIGACWQAFSFLLFKAGASALNLFLLEMGMQIHIYIYTCIYSAKQHVYSEATLPDICAA